jgi:hypothetical protein
MTSVAGAVFRIQLSNIAWVPSPIGSGWRDCAVAGVARAFESSRLFTSTEMLCTLIGNAETSTSPK